MENATDSCHPLLIRICLFILYRCVLSLIDVRPPVIGRHQLWQKEEGGKRETELVAIAIIEGAMTDLEIVGFRV